MKVRRKVRKMRLSPTIKHTSLDKDSYSGLPPADTAYFPRLATPSPGPPPLLNSSREKGRQGGLQLVRTGEDNSTYRSDSRGEDGPPARRPRRHVYYYLTITVLAAILPADSLNLTDLDSFSLVRAEYKLISPLMVPRPLVI